MNRFNYPTSYTSPYGGYPQNNDRFQPQTQNRPYSQESFPYGRTNAQHDLRLNRPTGSFPYSEEAMPRKITPPVKKEEEESISVSESDDDDDDNVKKEEASDNEKVSASDEGEEKTSDKEKSKSQSEEEDNEKDDEEEEAEEDEEDNDKDREDDDDDEEEQEEEEEVENTALKNDKKVENEENNSKNTEEKNLNKRVKQLNNIKFEMEDLETSLKKAFKYFDTHEPIPYESYISSTSNASKRVPSDSLKVKEINEIIDNPKENIMSKSNTSFSRLPERQELTYSRYSNSKPSTVNHSEESVSNRFLRQ